MLNPLCTWAVLGTGSLCLTRRYLWLVLSWRRQFSRVVSGDHCVTMCTSGAERRLGGGGHYAAQSLRQRGEPRAKINGEKVKSNQLSSSQEYPRRQIFIFVLWLLHVNIFVSGQKKGEVKSQTAQTLIFPLAAHTHWARLTRMKRRRFYPSRVLTASPRSSKLTTKKPMEIIWC